MASGREGSGSGCNRLFNHASQHQIVETHLYDALLERTKPRVEAPKSTQGDEPSV